MKKILLLMLCITSAVWAEKEPVSVDVYSGKEDLYHIELEPGQAVEIERLLDRDAIDVRSGNLLPRVGSSLFKMVADSPFFTALAVWALIYSPKSISNHPVLSTLIGGVLISDFALNMLHTAQEKIKVVR